MLDKVLFDEKGLNEDLVVDGSWGCNVIFKD